MNLNTKSLPLLGSTSGCSCCDPDSTDSTDSTDTAKETAMNTQTFPVTGMTCGHCVGAVTSELKEIPGVTDVDVDLVAGGTSTVTVASETAIDEKDVAASLDEAGDYQLATS